MLVDRTIHVNQKCNQYLFIQVPPGEPSRFHFFNNYRSPLRYLCWNTEKYITTLIFGDYYFSDLLIKYLIPQMSSTFQKLGALDLALQT